MYLRRIMDKKFIKMIPPLTYYGGKQKMLRHILPLIPAHKVYSEPFFGGGAVFWAKEPAKVEFINDINGEVINFYEVLQCSYSELKREIDATLHSEFQQKKAKQIYFHPQGHSEVERAWAIWALAHQSFYSKLDGTWKCSKKRSTAIQVQGRKEAFKEMYAKRLEHTSIFCRDALDVIKKTDCEGVFHYVDPPYFNANMGHYAGCAPEDFEKLLLLLATLKGKFMLSSYPSELLSSFVQRAGWRTIELDLPRSAGGGRKTEVLTMNYSIEQSNNLFNGDF
jgi:DNA adenine methylase